MNPAKSIEPTFLDTDIDGLSLRLVSFNAVIGDIAGNTKIILAEVERAEQDDIDLVVFPELAVTGYPPEDLLLHMPFLDAAEEAVKTIARVTRKTTAILGAPTYLTATESFLEEKKNDAIPILINQEDVVRFNSAIAVGHGKIIQTYHKQALPNYGVFNEKRFFTPGNSATYISIHGKTVAITICEDIWETKVSLRLSNRLASLHPDLVVNLSASPYQRGKVAQRREIAKNFSVRAGAPVAYCNLFGATDQLVFDGDLFLVRNKEILEERLPFISGSSEAKVYPENEEVYNALKTALRDYIGKNGFKKIALGLSGGLDSALVALIAVDALGKENVCAAIMPTSFSSEGTQSDAERMAKALDIEYHVLPIEKLRVGYSELLYDVFGGEDNVEDVTEENIQARIRGNVLMALSNKFGSMVIATGNKSELSVGYSTIYGDMSGGYSLIKDVLKTEAFDLTQWRIDLEPEDSDLRKTVQSIIDRPPSAELREDQKDSDSLPPYPLLDRILIEYVEAQDSPEEIIETLLTTDLIDSMNQEEVDAVVRRVIGMVDRAEHKRQQSSPGPKIRSNAFGSERRMPIINRFR